MKTRTLRNAISIALFMAAIGTSEWAMAQDATTDTATQGRAPVTKAPAKTQPKKSTDKAAVSARSEEHTSELQSLMRISYAVFCLKTKKKKTKHIIHTQH